MAGKLKSLDTPLKRMGFSLFLFGCLLMIVGLLVAEPYKWWYFWDRLLDFMYDSVSLSYGRYEAPSHRCFALGFYLMIVGLMLSFLYDKTIGIFASWIINGSKN